MFVAQEDRFSQEVLGYLSGSPTIMILGSVFSKIARRAPVTKDTWATDMAEKSRCPDERFLWSVNRGIPEVFPACDRVLGGQIANNANLWYTKESLGSMLPGNLPSECQHYRVLKM